MFIFLFILFFATADRMFVKKQMLPCNATQLMFFNELNSVLLISLIRTLVSFLLGCQPVRSFNYDTMVKHMGHSD